MPSVKEITYEKLMTSLEEQQGTSGNGVVPDAITVQGVSHANKKRAKWSMIKDAVRHFKPGVSQTKTVEQYLIHYVSKIEKDLPPRKATKSTDSSSSARSSAPNNPPQPSEWDFCPGHTCKGPSAGKACGAQDNYRRDDDDDDDDDDDAYTFDDLDDDDDVDDDIDDDDDD
eukprot:5960606-Karenia_brevis.AAC.1